MTYSHLYGGTATFDTILGWPSGPGSLTLAASQARPDEHLRPEQTIRFELPALALWDWLYPGGQAPDLEGLKKLSATLTVTPHDGATALAALHLTVQSFAGTETYNLRAISSAAQIPVKADLLRFSLEIKDTASGQTATLAEDVFEPRAVFGGALPKKTLHFDSTPHFRDRVIEGGVPVAGADLLVSYTDHRVDTLVDASRLDRQIGTQLTGGRTGMVVVPLYGSLKHEVTCAVSFDDGQGFRPETALAPNTASRTLGAHRTCYEASVAVPAGVTRMWIYFHVKTSLVVSYPSQSGVVRWYEEGAVIPRAERWDNPGAQPYVDYEFLVEP